MSAPQNVIAVIFDFDDTLTDDSTTKLLESYGIDAQKFWTEDCANLVKKGWDPPLAYLKLILDNVGPGKPLEGLGNAKLREFGSTLKFYRGIPNLFKRLKKEAARHTVSNPHVEFYIISGGLEEVIRGSTIAPHVDGIIGCRFAEENGVVKYVQNVVSFTEKTRYLFEISKNLVKQDRTDPYAVNNLVPLPHRRIPFENMIYVGDGLTDVPCFSLLEQFDGTAFGVFDPKKTGSPKKAWQSLVAPKRVKTLNSPKYGAKEDLGALLLVAVESICGRLDVRTRTA